MRVYGTEVKITPQDLHKHLKFAFELKTDASRMVIRYSYAPKKYEGADAYVLAEQAFIASYPECRIPTAEDIRKELPLNNHITLSLERRGKLIGTAHRHECDATYYITDREASNGFTPTRIAKGEWAVVLSTHAVLSEEIIAKIEVDAE